MFGDTRGFLEYWVSGSTRPHGLRKQLLCSLCICLHAVRFKIAGEQVGRWFAHALFPQRIIQVVKRKTKFRSTTHPVKVLVNELQLILGIERLRQGPSHILTRAELLPASYGPTLQRKYANADEGGDDDSKASILKSFCIGKGETWPTDGSLGSDSTASVLTQVCGKQS